MVGGAGVIEAEEGGRSGGDNTLQKEKGALVSGASAISTGDVRLPTGGNLPESQRCGRQQRGLWQRRNKRPSFCRFVSGSLERRVLGRRDLRHFGQNIPALYKMKMWALNQAEVCETAVGESRRLRGKRCEVKLPPQCTNLRIIFMREGS